jgi:hypothetical protein
MGKIVHPSYYNWIPGIECMDVVKHFPFCTGNAIKYIWRAGLKDSETRQDDLRKAIYYLEIELGIVHSSEATESAETGLPSKVG